MSSQYIQLLMMGETSDDGSVTPETSDDGSVTPQTSDDGSDTRECRICFVGTENEGLIHPCLCSGGYKYVHRSCLEIWREIWPTAKTYCRESTEAGPVSC